ncbi:hypothetical protein [Streptosporangium sp. 'caverna']|nr:hypothetical protein [Streptosporangium sp. 'caverna']
MTSTPACACPALANVADLLTRLGAASRFQAALLAKEKGWS